MPKRLEFWFDVGSPTAYLAHTQMPGIAERTGAEIAWKPMLLGGVFKATGNTPPGTVEAKSAYYGIDLPRFARRYGVPFRRNPFFPIMTLGLMRGCLAAQRDGCFQTYADAVFTAMWVEEKNTGDLDVLREVLTAAGLDADALFAATQEPAIKQQLIDNTEEAVSRGAFGAPTFFVGGEMFFGQDRLDFVEEALAS